MTVNKGIERETFSKNTTPCPKCGHWRIAHRGEGSCMGTFGGNWCRQACRVKETDIKTDGKNIDGL